MDDKPKLLHIYSPLSHHCTAHIVGTRKGLEALSDAIDDVLMHTELFSQDFHGFFVNDGEGFALRIHMASEEGMEQYRLPYTAPEAQSWERLAEPVDNPSWPKKERR